MLSLVWQAPPLLHRPLPLFNPLYLLKGIHPRASGRCLHSVASTGWKAFGTWTLVRRLKAKWRCSSRSHSGSASVDVQWRQGGVVPACRRTARSHASTFFFLFTLTGYSLQFPCLTFLFGSRENEYKCSYFQRGECTEKGTMETRWHCASTLKASSLIHNSHSVSAGIGWQLWLSGWHWQQRFSTTHMQQQASITAFAKQKKKQKLLSIGTVKKKVN